jgi:hypothetical protein
MYLKYLSVKNRAVMQLQQALKDSLNHLSLKKDIVLS